MARTPAGGKTCRGLGATAPRPRRDLSATVGATALRDRTARPPRVCTARGPDVACDSADDKTDSEHLLGLAPEIEGARLRLDLDQLRHKPSPRLGRHFDHRRRRGVPGFSREIIGEPAGDAHAGRGFRVAGQDDALARRVPPKRRSEDQRLRGVAQPPDRGPRRVLAVHRYEHVARPHAADQRRRGVDEHHLYLIEREAQRAGRGGDAERAVAVLGGNGLRRDDRLRLGGNGLRRDDRLRLGSDGLRRGDLALNWHRVGNAEEG